MAIYPMKCGSGLCERLFDWHTKPDLYMQSKADGFRDCRCVVCGRVGATRIYPPDSAPSDLTVRGKWGRTSSPEIRGMDFSGKAERNRQAASAGRVVMDDGADKTPRKSKLGVTTYKHNGDAVVEAPPKDRTYSAVVEYLNKHGETKLAELIKGVGIDRKHVQEVVYGSYDTIVSTRRGHYKLLSAPS